MSGHSQVWDPYLTGLAVLCCLLSPHVVGADPLPTPQHWMGGRLMPAVAVPVDMADEKLTVELKWHRPTSRPTDGPEAFSEADVQVAYTLRADREVAVPIVFPVIGAARDVRFALDGAEMRTVDRTDIDLYSAYEKTWTRAIDELVGKDEGLAKFRAEARSEAAKSARPPAAGESSGMKPDAEHLNGRAFGRIFGRVDRRLAQLRLPWSGDMAWALTHYLLDDWDRLGLPSIPAPGADVRRRQLTAERALALAIDPKLPDPVALWTADAAGAAPLLYPVQPVTFISAKLNLKRGDNALTVHYRQRVSFANYKYKQTGDGRHPGPSHRQAGVFEFVLRTARFWRSFGDLTVTISLPPGTVYAEANLPGSTVKLDDPAPTVTCSARGLPEQNLAVTFADFQLIPGSEHSFTDDSGAPEAWKRMQLEALWDLAIPGDGFHGARPGADDRIVVAGGEKGATVVDAATGRVLKTLHVTGEVKRALILADRIVLGYSLRGKGYAKPSVAAACFDRRTYSPLWTRSIEGTGYQGYEPQPLAADGAIVLWANRGPALAVAPEDGKLLWQRTGSFRGVTLSTDGKVAYLSGNPAQESKQGGKPEGDARVLAVDVRTGKTLWDTPTGYESFVPALWGNRLLVPGVAARCKDPFVACLDHGSGKTVWRKPLADNTYGYNEVLAARVLENRLLLFTDGDVEARPADDPTRRLWHTPYGHQVFTPPRIIGDRAYVAATFTGLQEYNLTTGELTRQLTDTQASFTVDIVGDRAFTLDHTGLLTAWSLTDAGAPPPQMERELIGVPPADLADRLEGRKTTPPTAPVDTPGPRPGRKLLVGLGFGLAGVLVVAGFALYRRRGG